MQAQQWLKIIACSRLFWKVELLCLPLANRVRGTMPLLIAQTLKPNKEI